MRKTLSAKLRFEVFKRDSFTCQYCGRSAPEVLLHVDHIKPVKGGGKDALLNLITSCQECNLGKGPRELSDDSVVSKQQAQLAELNERRLQLEMMLEWREGLEAVRDSGAKALEDAIIKASEGSCWIREKERHEIRKWLRKHALSELLDAVETSFSQYMRVDDDGVPDDESVDKAFRYIPRIAVTRKSAAGKPYLPDLFYIRGILRNRLHYVDERMCLTLLERAHLAGASIESLRSFARDVRNWTNFRSEIEEFLLENEGDDGK